MTDKEIITKLLLALISWKWIWNIITVYSWELMEIDWISDSCLTDDNLMPWCFNNYKSESDSN